MLSLNWLFCVAMIKWWAIEDDDLEHLLSEPTGPLLGPLVPLGHRGGS